MKNPFDFGGSDIHETCLCGGLRSPSALLVFFCGQAKQTIEWNILGDSKLASGHNPRKTRNTASRLYASANQSSCSIHPCLSRLRLYNTCNDDFEGLIRGIKCFIVITIDMCDSVNNFQEETCCLHLETIFTEEHRGLIEIIFITWCNDNHLKPNISKTNKLMVYYQRNRIEHKVVKFEAMLQIWMLLQRSYKDLFNHHSFKVGTQD